MSTLVGTAYIRWLLDHYYPGVEVADSTFFACKKRGAAVRNDYTGALERHAAWHEELKVSDAR